MKNFREWSVAMALLVILAALAIWAPAFFQVQPLLSLLTREAPGLVVTGGMALVILCRQIDISVGSQFAVCGVGAGLLAAQHCPLPIVGLALVIFLVVTIAFSQMEGTFSVYLIHRFLSGGILQLSGSLWELEHLVGTSIAREASMKSAWVFVAVGVTSTIIQGGLIGPLKKRFSEPTLVVAGGVFLVLGLGGIPLAPTYGWLFVPAVVMAAGSALVNPSMSSLVSLYAPVERQGEVMGAYQAMGSLGRIVGPPLGGFFFSAVGAASPYFAAAGMMAVGVVLSVVLRTRALRTRAA